MSEAHQRVHVHQNGDVLILTIEPYRISEYEMAEAVGRELLAAALERQATKVVVDMGNVQYMGSVGYGPFITLRARIHENGGRVILCNMSPVIKELFETTRLLINPHNPQSLFEFTDSVETAISMLQT
jgi:anti-anti-sigma factor